MKKIPITLEQYECIGCKRKWYINTQDKKANAMECPYGCEEYGNITRKFDMVINNYEEYVQTDIPTLNDELKGVDEQSSLRSPSNTLKGGDDE